MNSVCLSDGQVGHKNKITVTSKFYNLTIALYPSVTVAYRYNHFALTYVEIDK